MLQEFKTFIAKGNVLDLAVGIIIGAAFGKITSSLVEDILNPILGLAIGGVNFNELKIVLKQAVGEQAEVAIRYGNFLQTIIQFLLIAIVIFFIVRFANRMKTQEKAQ
jgi:large conductance mechanosensitive channel